MKKIILIRHGESTSNCGKFRDFIDITAELTPLGIQQCKNLRENFKNIKKFYLIVSPLNRASDSAKLIFDDTENSECNVLVTELSSTADRARNIYDYENTYTFKILDKNRYILHYNSYWNYEELKCCKTETFDELLNRCNEFMLYINRIDYNTIIIVSHGSFIKKLLEINNIIKDKINNCEVIEFYL